MSGPRQNVTSLALLLVGIAVGYSVARWQGSGVVVPTRGVKGAVVPAGIASELRAALLNPDSFERTAQLSRLLEPLGPEALPEVRAAYESVVLDLGDIELVLLVEWWGRFAPEDAYQWARESAIGWHPAVVTSAMRAWARRDPRAASGELTRSFSDPRLIGAGMIGLVRGWEESGQSGLEGFFEEIPTGTEDYYFFGIDTLARGRILREGPEAAIAWVEALPDTEDGSPTAFKLRALQRLTTMLASEHDPQLAGALAARHRGRAIGVGLVLRAGTAWAERDGEAAMRWLATLSPGREIPVAVQETYRMWLSNDRPAASKWLEAQPLAEWLDPAVAVHAKWRTGESFPEALEWAGRIQESDRRDKTFAAIFVRWMRKSPEEAQAALEQMELTDSARQRIARLKALRIDKKPRKGDRGGATGAARAADRGVTATPREANP